MPLDIDRIITDLLAERARIDRTIAALREVQSTDARTPFVDRPTRASKGSVPVSVLQYLRSKPDGAALADVVRATTGAQGVVWMVLRDLVAKGLVAHPEKHGLYYAVGTQEGDDK